MKAATYEGMVAAVKVMRSAFTPSKGELPKELPASPSELVSILEWRGELWMQYGHTMNAVEQIEALLENAAVDSLEQEDPDAYLQTAAERLSVYLLREHTRVVFAGRSNSTSDMHRLSSECKVKASKNTLRYMLGIEEYSPMEPGMARALLAYAEEVERQQAEANAKRPQSATIIKSAGRFTLELRNSAGTYLSGTLLEATTRVTATKEARAILEANNTPWVKLS